MKVGDKVVVTNSDSSFYKEGEKGVITRVGLDGLRWVDFNNPSEGEWCVPGFRMRLLSDHTNPEIDKEDAGVLTGSPRIITLRGKANECRVKKVGFNSTRDAEILRLKKEIKILESEAEENSKLAKELIESLVVSVSSSGGAHTVCLTSDFFLAYLRVKIREGLKLSTAERELLNEVSFDDEAPITHYLFDVEI